MNPLKVLIAYDSSHCSDDMLLDLQRAGLPEDVEAEVISFAAVWLTEPEDVVEGREPVLDSEGASTESDSSTEFRESVEVARNGRDRIHSMFPKWAVTSQAHASVAVQGTLDHMIAWKPDLLVVGSHGRSTLGRIIFGSVGQKLLAASSCSVRIGRAPFGSQPGGSRVIVAVDGSPESNAAVSTVASRNWPEGTAVRVVAVYDPTVFSTGLGVETPVGGIRFEHEEIRVAAQRAADALGELERAGLAAGSIVIHGNPSDSILAEAERWGADMIFLGARGHGVIERTLFGSVSNEVVTRAHCSVEVVRNSAARGITAG